MLTQKFQAPLAVVALLATYLAASPAKAIDYLYEVQRNVIDTEGKVVHGVVMPNGDIIDASGRVIGHAVVGMLDPSGSIIDTSGRTVTRIYTTTSPAASSTTTVTVNGSSPSFLHTDTLTTIIDNRRLELANMIDSAIRSGSLKASQAGEFNRSLGRIESAETQDKDSGAVFSYDEASDVARDLDALATSIAASSGLTALSPLIVVNQSGTTRFNVMPNGYYLTTLPADTTTRTTIVKTEPAIQKQISETTTTTTTRPGTLITTPAGSSALVTTNTSPSTVVYVRDIAPTTYLTTLEMRRKDLHKLISEAKEKKVITDVQADLLLSDLDRIQRESVPTITYGRAVLLARDLDVIGSQIATVVPAVPEPIITGSHLTIAGGQLATLDDVAVRRSDLEGRIATDYLKGRLTQKRADDLRARMNAIDTMEATFRQHPGDLTLKESRILYDNYDKVASDLDKWAGKENQ
jgi:hypothetical protein